MCVYVYAWAHAPLFVYVHVKVCVSICLCVHVREWVHAWMCMSIKKALNSVKFSTYLRIVHGMPETS